MTAQPVEDEPVDTGALDDLSLTLNQLAAAVAALSDDVPAALDVDDSSEAVVRLLADLREQRKALAEIEAYVEACAVKRLAYGQQRVGEYVAEVRGGKDRKAWQHDRLAFAACQDLAVDDMGVVVPEVAQIVGQVRDRLLNCAQISGWRVLQLRPLGIDVEAYCESVPGRRTVQVTPAVEAAADSPAHGDAA